MCESTRLGEVIPKGVSALSPTIVAVFLWVELEGQQFLASFVSRLVLRELAG